MVLPSTAGRQGLEPRLTGPEPVDLPLDDLPAVPTNCTTVSHFLFRTNAVRKLRLPLDDPPMKHISEEALKASSAYY